MSYTHFTRSERERIVIYQSEGYSLGKIAEKLGRDKGALSREIKRNSCSSGIGYNPEFAQYHAQKRRNNANKERRKIHDNTSLSRYIFQKLRARWSPEDISQSLKKNESIPSVCPKTIYSFIERKHPEMKQYLSVLSHKKPRPKWKNPKELIPNRKWIDDRPKEAERREPGHWEGDTIVSGCRKKAIGTFAERHSGFYMAKKMENRTAQEMDRVTQELFALIPQEKKKTITDDNGPEFAEHQKTTLETSIPIYFAHPYHSWERPVNERTNRELRRFFPKGTLFSEIEDWELDWAVNLINNKPRKRLGYKTPAQVFWKTVAL